MQFKFLIYWLLFPLCAKTQQGILLSDSIAFNSKVRFGVLENGFTYYIFRNLDANKKIVFSLIEKAGNFQDQDGERGITHLIEHISFRSTQNFPEGLRKSMRNLGLKPGEDLNANTSAILTTYNLAIPGGDSILLKYALQGLHDFAKGRLYKPTEVDEERAAVLNEVALGNDKRLLALHQESYLLLDKKKEYAFNISEIIQNTKDVTIEALRRFDMQWYRPDMQALIIVGDINELQMEEKVKTMFSMLKSETRKGLPSTEFLKKYDAPLTGKNKLVVVNHGSDQPTILIKIMKKRKSVMGRGGASTAQQFRVNVIDEVYNELMKDRFSSQSLRNQAEFQMLSHRLYRRAIHPFAGIDALTTHIELNQVSQIKNAVLAAMRELRKVQKLGFSETEFITAREVVRNNIKMNLETQTSSSVVTALANCFVEQAAFPENLAELMNRLLDDISLSEINAIARDWISEDGNTDVLFSVLDEKDSKLPNEKQIFSWLRAAMHAEVKPEEKNVLKSLPSPPKEINRSLIRKELSEIGATQLLLPNGVEIILKRMGSQTENPSTSKSEITLQGFRAGGASLYSPSDLPSASIAANLIKESGIGPLNNSEFKDWLKNKNRNGYLFVNLYLNNVEEGIVGNSSLNNFGDLLHLVHLYFTVPRKDKNVFNEKFKYNHLKIGKPKSNDELFRDSIQAVVNGNTTNKPFGAAQFEKAFRIYKERFSSARNFKFVIVGYFETEDIVRQVMHYLGALPDGSLKVKPANYENNTEQPLIISDNLRATLIGDSTGNVDVKMLFKGRLDLTIRNRLLLDLTKNVVNILLFDRLREQEKGVYYATSGLRFNRNPNEFFLDIAFPTAPEKVERLTVAMIDELNKIAKGTLDDNIFKSARETTHSGISRDLKNPDYLKSYIVDQLRKGKLTAEGFEREQILNRFTKQDVIDLIRNSLNIQHYILFKLL